MAVDLVGAASGTYTVQHTNDDITAAGFDPSTANWHDHAFLVSQTTSKVGNLEFPATALRLQLAAGASGDFTFSLTFAG